MKTVKSIILGTILSTTVMSMDLTESKFDAEQDIPYKTFFMDDTPNNVKNSKKVILKFSNEADEGFTLYIFPSSRTELFTIKAPANTTQLFDFGNYNWYKYSYRKSDHTDSSGDILGNNSNSMIFELKILSYNHTRLDGTIIKEIYPEISHHVAKDYFKTIFEFYKVLVSADPNSFFSSICIPQDIAGLISSMLMSLETITE